MTRLNDHLGLAPQETNRRNDARNASSTTVTQVARPIVDGSYRFHAHLLPDRHQVHALTDEQGADCSATRRLSVSLECHDDDANYGHMLSRFSSTYLITSAVPMMLTNNGGLEAQNCASLVRAHRRAADMASRDGCLNLSRLMKIRP